MSELSVPISTCQGVGGGNGMFDDILIKEGFYCKILEFGDFS